MSAVFHAPYMVRTYVREFKRRSKHWRAPFTFTRNKKRKFLEATGVEWLDSFANALHFLHLQVPHSADNDWLDAEGLPAWIILPKTLPTSWNYALYSKLRDIADAEEAKFIRGIEKKRKAYEKKAAKHRKSSSKRR